MELNTKNYTTTIGLEVHAELKTNTKMFCNSANDPHAGEPNTHVCPICMGHPGTLPVINKEAVKHVLTVGIALGSEIATYTEFDRKNYFYPDIPKGYQISQYLYPLVKGGVLNGVSITRVHLEEDTARSLHDQGDGSIVDYNRAGVPLMELVTEPVIHDAKTAGNFARELQLLLRTLGVSDANMEKGEMRVEANISVSKTDTFGTKVEVKNLNSFKSVEAAIAYEVHRHIELLEQGESIVQETRGWDENKSKTFSQRKKESANDYRYFPDPDVPKIQLTLSEEFSIDRLAETMPLLPSERRQKYKDLAISREQSETIISDSEVVKFFDSVSLMANDSSTFMQRAASYLVTDVMAICASSSHKIEDASVKGFFGIITLLIENRISSRVAKDLIQEVVFGTADPSVLVSERGLEQSTSKDDIRSSVEAVINSHPTVVNDYRGGKDAALQYLIGQGMKATRGAANPAMLKELLIECISGK